MTLYSDLNQYNPTDQPLLTEVEAIYQSLNNIFSTKLGERLFKPEFGSELENHLFDFVDDTTQLSIFSTLVGAIERWEPRVTLDYGSTEILPDPNNNKFDVTVVFSIDGFDDQNFEYRGSVLL